MTPEFTRYENHAGLLYVVANFPHPTLVGFMDDFGFVVMSMPPLCLVHAEDPTP